MGHSQASKAETHDRIVQIATRRLRETGLDGLSVADLMKEAGLTVGGFYKHFESREALVAEAVGCAIADARAGRVYPSPEQAGFTAYVEQYLSEAHRDAPGRGCVLTALSADAARHGGAARSLLAESVERTFAVMAAQLGTNDEPAREQATVALSAMIGALTLARLIEDPERSRDVLATVAEFLRRDLAPQPRSTAVEPGVKPVRAD